MLLSCRPSRRARSVLVVCVRRPRPSFRARRVCMAVHRAAAPAHQYARVFCVRRPIARPGPGARASTSCLHRPRPIRAHDVVARTWSLSVVAPASGSWNAAGAAGGLIPQPEHVGAALPRSSRTKGGGTAHPSPRRRARQPRLGQSTPRRACPPLTGVTFFAGRRYWFS